MSCGWARGRDAARERLNVARATASRNEEIMERMPQLNAGHEHALLSFALAPYRLP